MRWLDSITDSVDMNLSKLSTLFQYVLFLTNYICSDPISKEGQILKYWGSIFILQNMNGGRDTIQSIIEFFLVFTNMFFLYLQLPICIPSYQQQLSLKSDGPLGIMILIVRCLTSQSTPAQDPTVMFCLPDWTPLESNTDPGKDQVSLESYFWGFDLFCLPCFEAYHVNRLAFCIFLFPSTFSVHLCIFSPDNSVQAISQSLISHVSKQ